MPPPISSGAPLSEIAIGHPAASRVFQRLQLDFGCDADRTLSQACADRGLDPEAVIREILDDVPPLGSEAALRERPLEELVAHVVGHYHRRLREELPALVSMARTVELRHADEPACPRGLARHLETLQDELFRHLDKEERALFPTILAGQGRLAGVPIRVMEAEHEEHAAALAETRDRTTGYTPPEGACPTWRALYLRLREFELELTRHIHLENQVLFPRALRS